MGLHDTIKRVLSRGGYIASFLNKKYGTSKPPVDDVERQIPKVVIFKARRISTGTTLCLLLTSLIVVSIGIFGSNYIFNQYISATLQSFKGSAQVPLPSDEYPYSTERDNSIIEVPDFKDGRNGLFIHDFAANITWIVDITGNRCFVMAMNRENIHPPKSFFDLTDDMYKVDTEVIRESMRAVIPSLKDLNEIGTHIATECEAIPVYKLEKCEEGLEKRSADLNKEAKFTQFSENKIIEFNIMNLDDMENYEKENKFN